MSSIMGGPELIVSRQNLGLMADIRHIAGWYRHPIMLIGKVACMRAFMTCVTVMSTVVLSATQAEQTARTARCSTKCNSTLQFLR